MTAITLLFLNISLAGEGKEVRPDTHALPEGKMYGRRRRKGEKRSDLSPDIADSDRFSLRIFAFSPPPVLAC